MKQIMTRSQVRTAVLASLFFLFSFSFSALECGANNIRIEGPVSTRVSGGVATTTFTVKWDNSWRDVHNWDAAWIFLKYKNMQNPWMPVKIKASGNTLTGNFKYENASPNPELTGVFVHRSTIGEGEADVTCSVKWATPYTQEQFDNEDVLVLVQALEMVYIPYGAFYVGDGVSQGSFPVTSVGGEEEMKAGSTTLANTYPKGYQAFYCMKYEVSQEQYATFLNMLTYAQQQAMIPGLTNLQAGDYIFGAKDAPSFRNGIIVSQVDPGKAYLFDNNLTLDANYGEPNDGKSLACNYMCVNDMLAYAAWAGLRPMSELEFEKVCRRPFPHRPDARELAWNSAEGIDAVTSVSNGGEANERVLSGNVNAGSRLTPAGPVRCGVFATNATSQRSAGASYWGVMEMSGNVKELCANVSNIVFYSTAHGDGIYSLNAWGTTPSYFGKRGGGFASEDEQLATSDRSEITLTSLTLRDSAAGFRLVRTVETKTAVTAGTIKAEGGKTTACQGESITIENVTPASVNVIPALTINYVWYVNGVAIPNSNDPNLTYEDCKGGISYAFVRRAYCAQGYADTPPVRIQGYNSDVNLNFSSISMDKCDVPNTAVTAVPVMPGGSFRWLYRDAAFTEGVSQSGNNSVYNAARSNFQGNTGTVEVICERTLDRCVTTKPLTVAVTPTLTCPTVMNDATGIEYPVVRIGCYCWMGKNMQANSNGRLCYNNTEANCTTYGGLYNQPNAVAVCNAVGDGWHLPSSGEWNSVSDDQKVLFNPERGGYYYNGAYNQLSTRGNWWSSTLYSGSNYYYSQFNGTTFTPNTSYWVNSYYLSVRCVRAY